MKKILLLLLLLYSNSFSLFSQKKILDLSVPGIWPIITPRQISNDGNYVLYTIDSPKKGANFVVQATAGSWKKEISRFGGGGFTEDSRRLVFRNSGDSLEILDLASDSLHYIDTITSFVTPKEGDGQWVAYSIKHQKKELILLNLFTGEERQYANVTDFSLSGDGKILVLQTITRLDSADVSTIVWITLTDGKMVTIGQGYQAINLIFDNKNEQIAFLVNEEIISENVTTLRYYKPGLDSAIILAGPSIPGMEGMRVSLLREISFSPNASRIFFYVENPPEKQVKSTNGRVPVLIRNYVDDIRQIEIIPEGGPYLAVTQTSIVKKVIQLQKRGDTLFHYYDPFRCQNDYVLLEKDVLDFSGADSNRISGSYHDIYLANCRDGSRVLVKKRLFARTLLFSPAGKYLYWYDEVQNQWFAYNISLHITRNITSKIVAPLSMENDKPNRPSGGSFPIVGWIENDAALLIQDRYDFWQVDPESVLPPINITNEYGQKHHIQLRYMDLNEINTTSIHTGDTLLFSAFDQSSKMNGFFRVILGRFNNPEKLIMEPRIYFSVFSSAGSAGTFHPFFPLKAKSADVYLVERMSAVEYPNLYITTNFKDFKPLTYLEPQQEYNWFSTELHHWKLPNGREATGVLYKPENFDPHKKYPIVFYYYEKNSDALNSFIHPALCDGTINIPFFVSNGYLVFIPDIYYKTGYPGQSAYNSVVSAALYLSHMSFVDKFHMGLQGHSFGGFETNYIITRTHLFAAAAPSAGMSDVISGSDAPTRKTYYETGQGRIGASMWLRQDLYIENSPIFRANKVTTPVLIMHNPNDESVPFSQADEWYYGLVRSGKKVWMLLYEGEGHVLQEDKNELDYTIRLKQFFDHYLKEARAPKWMTVGMDRETKDIDAGSELDYSGKNP